MFPQTAAQWHAMLNDFPSLLFLLALAFDLTAEVTKRESLRAAGFWTLVVGAAGALAAVLSGLRAEGTIEHGGSVHMVMSRHETLAISVTALFVGLAAWRIWRRGNLGPAERPIFLSISGVGVLGLLWTAHIGGTLVYEYGGGIPTPVMEGALEERRAGHTHAEGEEHEGDEAAGEAEPDHIDPPGTPEHEHD